MSHEQGWVGVDLDATLAYYDGWKGPGHIGAPIPAMLERVKRMIGVGKDVRIFTARIASPPWWMHGDDKERWEADRQIASEAINEWCVEHLGRALPVTSRKDYSMIELYDDRCVQMEPNTGMSALRFHLMKLIEKLEVERLDIMADLVRMEEVQNADSHRFLRGRHLQVLKQKKVITEYLAEIDPDHPDGPPSP